LRESIGCSFSPILTYVMLPKRWIFVRIGYAIEMIDYREIIAWILFLVISVAAWVSTYQSQGSDRISAFPSILVLLWNHPSFILNSCKSFFIQSGTNLLHLTFNRRILLGAMALIACIGNSNGQTQTFETSGTFTLPAGITSLTVDAWGGGAGGSSRSGAAGGGGGGAYTKGTLTGLTPGSTITITVGTGGAAGAAGLASSVAGIVANGGSSTNSRDGGIGGISSPISGFVTASFAGGNGGNARGNTGGGTDNEGGGGGGGSATTSAAGTSGGNATSTGGTGGAGTGTGGRGADGDGSPDAVAGSVPGGGGGGRGEGSSTSKAGVHGRVIISWTCLPYSITGTSAANPICSGSTSQVTLSSSAAGLPVGVYVVIYDLSAPNAATGNTATLTVSPAGTGTFTTSTLTNTGETTITITNLTSGSAPQICTSALSGVGRTATITVNPRPVVTTQPQALTLCESSSGSFTIETSASAPTYQWQYSADQVNWVNTDGLPNVSGYTSNTLLLTDTPTAYGNFYVRCVVTENACPMNSNSVLLTVNPLPAAAGILTGVAAVCQGQNGLVYSVPAIANATGYSWTLPSGATIVGGANTNSITVNYSISATSGDITVMGTNGCGDGTVSASYAVIVNPLPDTAGIPTGTATVCQAQNGIVYSVPEITNATGYDWTLPTGATIIGGANTNSITVNYSSGATSGNITVSGSNSCGNGIVSDNLAVTVNPLTGAPIFTTGETSVCTNALDETYSATAANSTSMDYSVSPGTAGIMNSTSGVMNWDDAFVGTATITATATGLCGTTSTDRLVTVNPTTGPCSFTAGATAVCQNATDETYAATAANSTSINYSVSPGTAGIINPTSGVMNWDAAFSGTATITATATGLCGTTSATQTVNVTQAPTAIAPSNQTYCMGEITAVIPLSGTPSGVVFDISGGATIGLTNKTGVTQIPSYTATTGTATVTITPRANGCNGTPVSFSITVNPRPNIHLSASAQTICSGSSTNITISSSTSGATFSWIVYSISGTITGASDGTGNLLNQTLQNNTATTGTVMYQLTASALGCEGATVNFTVTVHPEVSANISGTTTVCQNDPTPVITFTASGGSAPYTFTYNINSGTDQQLTASSGNSASLNAPTEVSGTFDYNLVSVSGSTSCAYPQTGTATITVDPMPVLSSSLTPPGICSNDVFNYVPTSDIPGTSFSWDRAIVAGISNLNNSGTNNPAELLNNTTSDPIAVTYVYTLLSPAGCSNIQNVIVMVTPMPHLTSATSGLSICSGTAFTYTPTSDVPGTDFPWTRAAVAGISNPAASGTGNISEVLINTTNSLIEVIYIYTLRSNDCENPVTYSVAVDVLPAPVVTANTSPGSICPGGTVNLTSSSVPATAVNILWTSNTSGWTSTEANPTNVSPTETTTYTATYTDTNTGCDGSATTTVTVFPAPDATISANYCANAPKIRLTTGSFASYNWQPLPYGETNGNQYIDIDIAGIYTVNVIDANGCAGTASINVSNEYVTNGSFTSGNTGFTTPPSGANQYTYVVDNPGLTNELNPEGLYGIGPNAQNYHNNFWGVDHTSGTGNFMIVNGFPGSPQPIVWQETILNLIPNTVYYFSAWAISLNSAGNDAQLQFSINGTQLGSVADLTAYPGVSNSTNPWHPEGRFYGTWNSGSNTSAILSIVDLQTAAGGNDFGIDDISFGILDPSPALIAPTKSNDICSGGTIELHANVTDGKEPITFSWTGPNGFFSYVENPIIPNAGEEYEGSYILTVTDWYGCGIAPETVDVIVYPQATVDAGDDQLRGCSADITFLLDGSVGGGATNGTWSTSGTGSFDNASSLTAVYTTSAADIAAGSVSLTLTTDDPTGPCSIASDNMVITINNSPELTVDVNIPLCFGYSDGSATASVTSGTAPYDYVWSDGQTTATATGLANGTYTVTVTDANGCSDAKTTDVVEPSALVVYPASFVSPTCYGGSDGIAYVNAEGGTLPYIYQWDAAAGNQTTQSATGLSIGTYLFTVTDANGCNITSDFVLVTQPDPPILSCPPDPEPVEAPIGETSAEVLTDDPGYDPVCQILSWTMTGATIVSTPVSGIVPSPYNFNVGTTTVEYRTVNIAGDVLTCTFEVVVTPAPVLTCPDNIFQYTDPGLCSAAITIIQATATSSSVTITGLRSDGLPLTDPYPAGITTITWTASNASGSVSCNQTVTVTDNEPPTFDVPLPISECVESIFTAIYDPATIDINPDRPEYFIFSNGSTALNLTGLTDNCCAVIDLMINWRIDFFGGSPASITGTGQPSLYGEIQFPGDLPPYDDNLIHTITYWVEDCNGNVSDEQMVNITIKPRPNLIKTTMSP